MGPARPAQKLVAVHVEVPEVEQDLDLLADGAESIVPSPAWESWQRMAKRALDITVAVTLLVLLAPLLAVIALVIRLESTGPVIFRQTRCGANGRQFRYYKFRSMVANAEAHRGELEALNEADGPIFKIKADPRITRVGRILRRSSLDELPQLWNVLQGELRLVGPRPPIPAETAQYEPWHLNRLWAPGGMTGLWQVSGRSELSFDDMVRLDIDYIERWSIWLDVRVLCRTLLAVITMHGAY